MLERNYSSLFLLGAYGLFKQVNVKLQNMAIRSRGTTAM
jgi:hypothetical protein